MGELAYREHFSTTIPKELKKALKELSKKTKISQSYLTEEALEDLFIKYKKKME